MDVAYTIIITRWLALNFFFLLCVLYLTCVTPGAAESSKVEEYLALYEKGFIEEAIAGLKAEKAARPEAVEPPFYLGYIYGEMKMYEEAVTEFTNCLEINPDIPDVYYNLGTALNGLGEYERAAQEFEEALLLDPSFVDAMYNCGLSYYYQGKYVEAIKMYKEAQKLDAEALDIGFNLAVAYEELDPIVALRMWGNYTETLADDEAARPYYEAALKRMERLREHIPGP